jgi:HTH-type transcriptional regulator/antitoxin HipB
MNARAEVGLFVFEIGGSVLINALLYRYVESSCTRLRETIASPMPASWRSTSADPTGSNAGHEPRKYSRDRYIDFIPIGDILALFVQQMKAHMRQLITTPSQVGEILRGRRKARRVPQQSLAAKLGISQSRLSTLEQSPAGLTLDRLIVLAKLLGLELVLQDKSDKSGTEPEW